MTGFSNSLAFQSSIPKMRASMKLIVLLGMLFFAAPSLAAAKPVPAPPSRPQGSIYLRDWAEKNGFKLAYDSKAMTILLTNRWAEINLLNDSRKGSINGITVWLSFPMRVYNGRLIIHQKDLTTLIEPILYPKRLTGER